MNTGLIIAGDSPYLGLYNVYYLCGTNTSNIYMVPIGFPWGVLRIYVGYVLSIFVFLMF